MYVTKTEYMSLCHIGDDRFLALYNKLVRSVQLSGSCGFSLLAHRAVS